MVMVGRAMKISSDELFHANRQLRVEAKSLKDINKNLETILNSMNLESNSVSENNNFIPSEYIKKQSL